uniref:Uncharacterized protein n=1 Tax=Parascaris univalens TaxID=6257 RepID=A0A915B557_PARUN
MRWQESSLASHYAGRKLKCLDACQVHLSDGHFRGATFLVTIAKALLALWEREQSQGGALRMEVCEKHEKDIRALEAAEGTPSSIQSIYDLPNGPSHVEKWDADNDIIVAMRSDNESGEGKIRIVEYRTAGTPPNNYSKCEPIIEMADEDSAVSVNTGESTSNAVERLDTSVDQQISRERLKRAISWLRMAYAKNLDEACAAGDVMVADSYRKALEELDDAFLAIHSGALNYTTLPPYPAPYRSLPGRSIPYNLQSLTFPPRRTWHHLPYEYLSQPEIPGTYMPQFLTSTTSGSPYMYSAYTSETGQRLPLHQNTPPGFLPHAFVVRPNMVPFHSVVAQPKKPQTASTVTNEIMCVEDGEVNKRRPTKPAIRDAEMRPAEAEINRTHTKSFESEACSCESGSEKLDVAAGGTKLTGSQICNDGAGSNNSQVASDFKAAAVGSRTHDLENRPVTSNAFNVESTFAVSPGSQAVVAEKTLTGLRASDIKIVSDGSEVSARATSITVDAIAQATPAFEAKSIVDERDDRKSILLDEVPIFTSVDQRPPEFPAANYSGVVKKWAMHIMNVQQLLQLLIDVVEYLSTKKLTFSQENFEQFCGHDMLPRLDCMDFGELIDSEIVLIRPEDYEFYLNPILSELRFLVLTDVEWSIFRKLVEVDHIRVEDLADTLDFGGEYDWIPRKRRAAVWEVLLSEKLRGVFVVEPILRRDNETEFWIRINRCLDISNVVPRLIVFP